MTKDFEALKKRIEELDDEEVEELTEIIDKMITTKELCPEGYNLQAYRLAGRLARESGDTEDYWGDQYDEALAKLSQNNNLRVKYKVYDDVTCT